VRALHGRLARAHDLAAGRAGAFHEIGTRHRREALEIGERVFHRPIDHAVDDQAVLRRINIGDAGVMTLIVQARRRDGAVAVLQRRKCRGLGRVGPAHLGLELRARAVTAVHAHHAALLLGRIGRHRVLDRAGRRLGCGASRQHCGHPDRGNQSAAGDEPAPARRQCEHPLLAVAVLDGGEAPRLRLADAFAEAAERLLDGVCFAIRVFGVGGMHGFASLARRDASRVSSCVRRRQMT
jgi:hypothetical protein